MMQPLVTALLAVAVAASWLAAAAFVRLNSPLDRLHCVTFVNLLAGLAVLLAAFVADGASDRVLKVLLLQIVLLFGGAVMTHATGRAILSRRRSG